MSGMTNSPNDSFLFSFLHDTLESLYILLIIRFDLFVLFLNLIKRISYS